jgi:hypothetical protein
MISLRKVREYKKAENQLHPDPKGQLIFRSLPFKLKGIRIEIQSERTSQSIFKH